MDVNPEGKLMASGKDRLTSWPFIRRKVAQRRMLTLNRVRGDANKPPNYSQAMPCSIQGLIRLLKWQHHLLPIWLIRQDDR